MKILALDLATKTGWATNAPVDASGVVEFTLKRGESPGMRFLRYVRWLKDMVDLVEPDLVIYEQAHHRGGAATEVCVGLTTHTQTICASKDIEFTAVRTSAVKIFATGKGNASKDEMINACRERYNIEPIDDNQADALHILGYALDTYATETIE